MLQELSDDGVRHIDIDLAALRKEVDSDGVVSHDNYQGFVWLFEAMEKGKDGRKDDLIPLAGGFPSGKVYNDGATPVKAGHYLVKVNGKTFEDADGAGELMDAATNEYSEEGGRTYLTLSFATKIEKESGGGKGKGGAKDKAAGSGGDGIGRLRAGCWHTVTLVVDHRLDALALSIQRAEQGHNGGAKRREEAGGSRGPAPWRRRRRRRRRRDDKAACSAWARGMGAAPRQVAQHEGV